MSLNIPEADPADIIVIVHGGIVDKVVAPTGLSVQVRTYDKVPGGDLCKDDDGRICRVEWIKEPGEANHEEPPLECKWSDPPRRMAERLQAARDLLSHPAGAHFAAFPVSTPARWCSIQVDGEMLGWMHGTKNMDHLKPALWTIHLADHAPTWLKAVRQRGPYLSMAYAQKAILNAYDEHKRQGVL